MKLIVASPQKKPKSEARNRPLGTFIKLCTEDARENLGLQKSV